jgi:hypothetical protein
MDNKIIKVEERKDYQRLFLFVQKTLVEADKLKIKTPKDEARAVSLRGEIKENMNTGETLRKFLVTPYKKWIDAINARFSFVKELDVAYKSLGQKIVEHQNEKERKASEEKERILKEMTKGGKKLDLSKAVEEIQKGDSVEKVIESDGYRVSFREHKEVVIEDESKLPREYLMPDMAKIKNALLKENKKVEGAVVKINKIPVQL